MAHAILKPLLLHGMFVFIYNIRVPGQRDMNIWFHSHNACHNTPTNKNTADCAVKIRIFAGFCCKLSVMKRLSSEKSRKEKILLARLQEESVHFYCFRAQSPWKTSGRPFRHWQQPPPHHHHPPPKKKNKKKKQTRQTNKQTKKTVLD